MLLLLSLLACGPASHEADIAQALSAPAPELASAEAPPAEPPAEPPAVLVDLSLSTGELRWDEAGGVAVGSPGSSVKQAAYTHYVFDLKELEAALGGRPEGQVNVRCEILETTVETQTPDDPMSAQPEGGFTIATSRARVVSAESSPAP